MLYAKYGVLLRPENISGESLDVDVLADTLGGTVVRQVQDGDIVLEVSNVGTGATTGALWIVRDGSRWVLAPSQPAPGDVLVSLCSVTDLAYQAGSLLVFAEDHSFVPANFGLIFGL
jgi:hypothetical protein